MRQSDMHRFQPEVELLLACAREQALDNLDDHCTAFASDDLDWETIVSLARRHRLEPFVCRRLIDDSTIPSGVRTDLETTADALVRRNLYMSSELVDVVERLDEEGVRVLTYKGPSLAELAYRDITLRKFVDLDLLVPTADFADAIEVLCAGNYVVTGSRPAIGETTLQEQATDLLVDVHSRVIPPRYPFTLSFDQLWDRRVDVPLGGRAVQTFHPSDLLPILAIHGTKHFWMQLEWVVSFAALIQHEPIDWACVLERSKQAGYNRMVLLGLRLAHDLLGLSVPESVSTRVTDDWIVRLVSELVMRQSSYTDLENKESDLYFHSKKHIAQLFLIRGIQARGAYTSNIKDELVRENCCIYSSSIGT